MCASRRSTTQRRVDDVSPGVTWTLPMIAYHVWLGLPFSRWPSMTPRTRSGRWALSPQASALSALKPNACSNGTTSTSSTILSLLASNGVDFESSGHLRTNMQRGSISAAATNMSKASGNFIPAKAFPLMETTSQPNCTPNWIAWPSPRSLLMTMGITLRNSMPSGCWVKILTSSSPVFVRKTTVSGSAISVKVTWHRRCQGHNPHLCKRGP
mmetsp:Transcript_115102/g.229234  ORF Transcript_115102/g.229234 Transcript_115102/m.229234 type:complete len:212 (-) Transcript_115102:8-643(-)